MDNRDILFTLSVRLDNESLETLSRTPYWSVISDFAGTNAFWYERVKILVRTDIIWRPGQWKEVYYTLLNAIRADSRVSSLYDSREALSNSLAVEIALEVDPPHSWQQAYYAALRCIELGYSDSLALILSRQYMDPSRENDKLLRVAAKYGRPSAIRLLLSYPLVDPTADDNAAIEYAVGAYYTGASYTLHGTAPTERDYLEVVRLLLEDGRVNPFANGDRLLRTAQRRGRDELARLLIGYAER